MERSHDREPLEDGHGGRGSVVRLEQTRHEGPPRVRVRPACRVIPAEGSRKVPLDLLGRPGRVASGPGPPVQPTARVPQAQETQVAGAVGCEGGGDRVSAVPVDHQTTSGLAEDAMGDLQPAAISVRTSSIASRERCAEPSAMSAVMDLSTEGGAMAKRWRARVGGRGAVAIAGVLVLFRRRGASGGGGCSGPVDGRDGSRYPGTASPTILGRARDVIRSEHRPEHTVSGRTVWGGTTGSSAGAGDLCVHGAACTRVCTHEDSRDDRGQGTAWAVRSTTTAAGPVVRGTASTLRTVGRARSVGARRGRVADGGPRPIAASSPCSPPRRGPRRSPGCP
jgi:hypothetical protein